jgi:hypothetical protein
MMLSKDDIQKQSERAYAQWAKQWREHAKAHSKYPMKSMSDFENRGVGRAILCIGNGYSFEEEIETIKQHAANVDIICCDKSLGHLLSHGIKPTFCQVADANVNYEKYLKPWETQLQDTILIGNVCANPLWAEKGNWKDRYFFCVMDILKSEREFSALANCPNTMAAGTNVGNGLVIAVTQCDNSGRRNFMGYDKILLIGYDFSWSPDGKYYAFDETGSGKRNYMRHIWLLDARGELAWSSTNLVFSAKWLDQYVNSFNLPVVQCTKRTVFNTRKRGILSEQMQYRHRPEDGPRLKRLIELRRMALEQKKRYEAELQSIARDHHHAFVNSL